MVNFNQGDSQSHEEQSNALPENKLEVERPCCSCGLKRSVVYVAIILAAFVFGVSVAVFYTTNQADKQLADEFSLPVSEDTSEQNTSPDLEFPGALKIEWNESVWPLPACSKPIADAIKAASVGKQTYESWSDCSEYSLGSVIEGEYSGWTVLLDVPMREQEMGGPIEHYVYLLQNPEGNEYVWLTKYFDVRSKSFTDLAHDVGEEFDAYTQAGSMPWLSSSFVRPRADVVVAELEIADKTEWINVYSDESLYKLFGRVRSVGVGGLAYEDIGNSYNSYFASYGIGKLGNGRLIAEYRGSRLVGAFVSLRKDGRVEFFDLEVPFYKISAEQMSQIDAVVSPDISWNDGTAVVEYSKSPRTGCGSVGVADVVSKFAVGNLRTAGTTSNGDSIYESAEIPENIKWHYESWMYHQADDADKSVKAFLALHPYFFWEDSLGRMIRFSRIDLVPAAECGKPVIYLYPTEPTELVVKLNPRGGFSKTEPEYNDGWRVLASPNGTLVNKDDGLSYPYLFWEGRGGAYSSPEQFWSVSRENVEPFLNERLAKFGLNERETADFLEFWLPRMHDAPYYKIGFHGRAVMDQIAPLSLSSRPDTVIRVLMDYQELDKPISSNPPRVITPIRRGFTVVEWGGVLR